MNWIKKLLKGKKKETETIVTDVKEISDRINKVITDYKAGELTICTSHRYIDQILLKYIDQIKYLERKVERLEGRLNDHVVTTEYKHGIDPFLKTLDLEEQTIQDEMEDKL